jgi:hypothetical protein
MAARNRTKPKSGQFSASRQLTRDITTCSKIHKSKIGERSGMLYVLADSATLSFSANSNFGESCDIPRDLTRCLFPNAQYVVRTSTDLSSPPRPRRLDCPLVLLYLENKAKRRRQARGPCGQYERVVIVAAAAIAGWQFLPNLMTFPEGCRMSHAACGSMDWLKLGVPLRVFRH